MVYCICYDLNTPGKDYGLLIQEIKKYTPWWHHLDSTWFVETAKTSAEIRDNLRACIDKNDELLVFPVGSGWAAAGFQDSAYTWLHNHWN
jgi:hypothetical protein